MTKARDNATQGGLVLLNSTDFSAASTVSLNNIFSDNYISYKITGYFTTCSADSSLVANFTANGTENTTAYQAMGVGIIGTGAASNFAGYNFNNLWLCEVDSTYPGSGFTLDVTAPYLPQKSYGHLQTAFISGSANPTGRAVNYVHEVYTSFNGIKFTYQSGNVTGNIKVYGYRK